MTKFEKLTYDRYNARPFDFTFNPHGFGSPQAGEHYSDISAHLPLIELLARQCNHCTEFGMREGYSTIALLNGCDDVISYDVKTSVYIKDFIDAVQETSKSWAFRHKSSLANPIDPTDLLLIDSLHTYNQVRQELALHAHKVRKYIVFHDVASQGLKSLDAPGEEGIARAISEFLSENSQWSTCYYVQFNHGLQVIQNANSQ